MFADICDTEKGTFSVEWVRGLKPDLLITLAAGYTYARRGIRNALF
jgi:hypothetical protein